MTLNEAARSGVSRVRDPQWANPGDYLKVHLIKNEDGTFHHGPWLNLYSPLQSVMGVPTPQSLLFTSVNWDEDGWDVYTGELNEEDTD